MVKLGPTLRRLLRAEDETLMPAVIPTNQRPQLQLARQALLPGYLNHLSNYQSLDGFIDPLNFLRVDGTMAESPEALPGNPEQAQKQNCSQTGERSSPKIKIKQKQNCSQNANIPSEM